jgi:[ribosomal protein S5]-alanine N-acetyltransferase
MEFKLRPWTLNDLDSLCKHAGNSNVRKFMSDGFHDNRDKWRVWIEFASSDKGILYRAVEIKGEAAGGIGVSLQKNGSSKEAELGYWLSEDYWGLGVMTKAVGEMVKLSFSQFDIDRIFATPFETNYASHHVLEKAGFKLEAGIQKKVIKNGVEVNELVYAICKMRFIPKNKIGD